MNTQRALFRSGLVRTALVLLSLAGGSRLAGAADYQILHAFEAQPSKPEAGLVQGTDGALYGTTTSGGVMNAGVIFKMQPDGTNFTVLHEFEILDGCGPDGSLIDVAGVLYGTAPWCGAGEGGTVFKINEDGSDFTVLHAFDWETEGLGAGDSVPGPALVHLDGVLYGETPYGGSGGGGVLFSVGVDGANFTVLHTFDWADAGAGTGQLVTSGGMIYGSSTYAGPTGAGFLFSINPDGTGITRIHDFSWGTSTVGPRALVASGGTLYGNASLLFSVGTDGSGFTVIDSTPRAVYGLTASGNVLYGTSATGPNGSVFSIHTDGTSFTTLHTFDGTDAQTPAVGLLESGGVLYGTSRIGGAVNQGTAFSLNVDGTGFAKLRDFGQASGTSASPSLRVADGKLYGVAPGGGAHGKGQIFSLGEDGGGFTVLRDSAETEGVPLSALLKLGGQLVGTRSSGAADSGTIFRMNPDGTAHTTTHTFDWSQRATGGVTPSGDLATDGTYLYGVTTYGGVGGTGGNWGDGILYRIKPDGTGFKKLRDLNKNPYGGPVLVGGVLYGATYRGGASDKGTIYRVNRDGSGFRVLHAFGGADGANPQRSSLIAVGDILYGTTPWGGIADKGVVFKIGTDGSGFGTLHSFAGPDGSRPGQLLAYGGVLYGVTGEGGPSDRGVLFSINRDGTRYTALRAFDGADGASPQSLVPGSDLALYGVAAGGGPSKGGVIFRLVPDAELEWSAATYTGREAAGNVKLAVTRTRALPGSLTVNFTTSDGTAKANDYKAGSATLSFGPGETVRTITVPIMNDARAEGPETVKLTLSSPSAGAVLGARSSAVLTIADDDGPAIYLGAAQYSVSEASAKVTFTVRRSGSTAGPASVRVSTVAGTATAGSDYAPLTNKLVSFAAGVAAKNVTVGITSDGSGEGSETFVLRLASPTGAALGTQRTATVTVLD